jgi:ABC-2 type transport system ATP-binding protein
VRTTDSESLIGALRVADVEATTQDDGGVIAQTDDLRLVGDVALRAGVPVHELRALSADLEQLFFSLTEGTNRNLGDAENQPAPVMTDAVDGHEGANL